MVGETAHRKTSARQVTAASLIGTTIEWYEFFIYGTAAALVFPALFFPSEDPLVGILVSLSTFAVASWRVRSAVSSSGTSVTGSAARRPWS